MLQKLFYWVIAPIILSRKIRDLANTMAHDNYELLRIIYDKKACRNKLNLHPKTDSSSYWLKKVENYTAAIHELEQQAADTKSNWLLNDEKTKSALSRLHAILDTIHGLTSSFYLKP